MQTSPQVLAPLALLLALAPRLAAQPPDAPANIAAAKPEAPPAPPPLLPIKLDEWLAQNGGLARLKIKMEKATASEVAAEIKKQTGVDVEVGQNFRAGENAPRFTVESNGEPFWTAVANWQKGKKGGEPELHVNREYGEGGLKLSPWSHAQAGRGIDAGPCRVAISYLSVSRSHSVSLAEGAKADPNESRSMHLQGSLQVDPRLRSRILGMLWDVTARDDKGRAVKEEHNYSQPWLRDNDGGWMSLQLGAPEPDAKALTLAGAMRLAVVTKSEKWEVSLDAAPGTQKEFKGAGLEATVRFDGMEARRRNWEAAFTWTRKAVGPERIFKGTGEHGQSARLSDWNALHGAVRLVNDEGETVASSFSFVEEEVKDGARVLEADVSARRPRQGDIEKSTPVRAIVEVPLEWREITIPFEMKDLPLPQVPQVKLP